MKLYLLTNMYVGGQHPGIQGIHSAVRLVAKYLSDDRDFPDLAKQVYEYVDEHETVVMLQSGMDHKALHELVKSLDQLQGAVSHCRMRLGDDYYPKFPIVPFAEFKEPGLNNTITSVAVLCDSMMVNQMDSLRKGLITVDTLVENYGEVVGNLLNNMAYMRLV